MVRAFECALVTITIFVPFVRQSAVAQVYCVRAIEAEAGFGAKTQRRQKFCPNVDCKSAIRQ